MNNRKIDDLIEDYMNIKISDKLEDRVNEAIKESKKLKKRRFYWCCSKRCCSYRNAKC